MSTNQLQRSSNSHNYDAALLYYFSVFCVFFFGERWGGWGEVGGGVLYTVKRGQMGGQKQRADRGKWSNVICVGDYVPQKQRLMRC